MSDEIPKEYQTIELTEQEIDAIAGGNQNDQYITNQLNLVPGDVAQSVYQSVDKIFFAIPLIGLNI